MICKWYLIDEQEMSSKDKKAQIGGAIEDLVERTNIFMKSVGTMLNFTVMTTVVVDELIITV